MQPGTYSPDGRWWWDGRTWQPLVYRAPEGPPGMFWFFRTPGWAGPFFLTGLILMLPIVGQMVLYGWYLAARDNLRHGWRVLPRAGFQYLERGARPWVVALLYGLYALPVLLLLVGGLVWAIVAQSAVAIGLLAALLFASWLGYVLLAGYMAAAMYDLADAHGIGVAAHPGRVWARARADSPNSWRVFGAFFLGGLIYLGIGLVTLPILFFIPFGVLLLTFVQPGVFLMAVPAQADFNAAAGPPVTPGHGPGAHLGAGVAALVRRDA